MGFSAEVNAWALKTKGGLNTNLKKVLIDMSASIVAMSPVDTGRFRANWQYGFGVAPAGKIDATDVGGAQGSNTAATLAEDILKQTNYAGVHFIVNNLDYAQVLEFGLYPDPPKHGTGKTVGGYSKQAPGGMVRITAQRWDEFITKHFGK